MKLIFVKKAGDVLQETTVEPTGAGYAEITDRVSNGPGGYNMTEKRTVKDAEAKEIMERLVKKGFMALRG